MKKKILIMFCILSCIALAIIGWFNYFSGQQAIEYEKTAVPYMNRVIPELSKWDPEIARKYMSTEFLQKVSPERFNLIIKTLSKIGSLQDMDKPKFEEIYAGKTPKGVDRTIISYTVNAKYSTGDAIITMSLLEQNGILEVYRFNVQSEALAR